MIQQGELVAGKYRVEQLLGGGGMGYVVAAMHQQLGQRVAVKLLAPNLCEDPHSVTRFLREARAAVRIRSEHVARVLDVGELPDGTPFMVMEFLSGRDLAAELDEPELLDIPKAIDYLLQASEAVAEAHSIGVIHRDLKPANLFLTSRPDGSPLVKVLDFGISKAVSAGENSVELEPSLTETHSVLGSPAYMSPEQVRRPKSVDTRTDIWSLGSILYELLTREPPFGAESPLAVLAAVVSDPSPDVREKRPDVPPELAAVIAKCLQKNPDDRYQTVAELAFALAPFAPRSQPSVSRISGILRAAPLPPTSADKSPSSDRTLASHRASPQGGDISEPKVKVITPFPPSEKSTETDWESGAVKSARSRLALVAGVGGALALVGVVLWQRQGSGTRVVVPEKPVSAAPASVLRPSELLPPPTAPPATTAAAPAALTSTSSSSTTNATPPSAAVSKSLAPHRPPLRPLRAPPSTPHKAPLPASAADPLDGRR